MRKTGASWSLDVLHYCLPVCSPYFALQGYKYRVKLAQGKSKKGKAAKLVQAAFLRAPDCAARERDLIRAVQDNGLVAKILGNVRVVTPAAAGGGGNGRKGLATLLARARERQQRRMWRQWLGRRRRRLRGSGGGGKQRGARSRRRKRRRARRRAAAARCAWRRGRW